MTSVTLSGVKTTSYYTAGGPTRIYMPSNAIGFNCLIIGGGGGGGGGS